MGAFLHGEFHNGKEIYTEVPQGWEGYYSNTAVLKLLKCIYELKQAAMAFWVELLKCMKDMGMKRSNADPCLYYNWSENGLALMVSWIDDNLIVGNEKVAAETKAKLMARFECSDEGELKEFVGNKIDRTTDGGLKFTQPVLIQSFDDEFDLPKQKFTTPAKAGDMLTKCEQKDSLSPERQTEYRAAIGKAMHVMQYSRGKIYNSVR